MKNYTPFLESLGKLSQAMEIKKQQSFLSTLEEKFRKEIKKLFRKQGKLFSENIREDHIDLNSLDIAFDMTIQYTRKQFIDLFIKYKTIAAYSGIRSQARILGIYDLKESAVSVGISFKAVDTEAYKYIAENAADRVSKIDDTTRNRIRGILEQGTADKKSYSEIARNIRDEFYEFGTPAAQQHIRDRAELVAVTEIRDAHEHSQGLVREELSDQGWEMEKAWGISNDENTCEICKKNADAGWIKDNEIFPSGDKHPSAHPGCRCYTMTRNTGKRKQSGETIRGNDNSLFTVAAALTSLIPVIMARNRSKKEEETDKKGRKKKTNT